MRHLFQKGIYLIADIYFTGKDNFLERVKKSLDGGLCAVQFRFKNLAFDEALAIGESLKPLVNEYRIPLIINDSIELTYQLEADGVHIGQHDSSPEKAHQSLPNHLIGLTVHSDQQIQNANLKDIDYVGLGTVFPTTSKSNIQGVLGIGGLKKALMHCQKPCVVIGGINKGNINQLKGLNIHAVAVLSGILGARDPAKTVLKMHQAIFN